MTENTKLAQQHCENAKKKRDTNLELFRVITMFFIIAHHYVVNSGLFQMINENPTSAKSIFLLLFGAWGKIGINCFVMITGYFMCKSSMTAKKFFKLLVEVMFYRIVINGIFWVVGYQPLSFNTLLRLVPITSISDGFTDTYLVFMLCIPFINILLNNLTQKQHFYLMLLMSFLYVFFGTLRPIFSVTMDYVSWYFVLYLFASYVRLYPNKVFDSAGIWGWITVAAVAISAVSVVAGAWVGTRIGKNLSYYFVTDANTFLAFATGFSSFMFFKNIKIPYNKFINALAATCFGVLQIHANSDTMRNWLWGDVLNNVGAFSKAWLPIHAIGSVTIIFLVCAGIDYLRIIWVEKPLFNVWDKHWPKVVTAYKQTEEKLLSKLGISM